MVTKVELKEFTEIKKCKKFINDFIKDKNPIKIEIFPIIKKDIMNYFTLIEYED